MRIGIPEEVHAGETGVAMVPSLVPLLKKDRHEVLVEAGAGVGAWFSDTLYLQAGASLVKSIVKQESHLRQRSARCPVRSVTSSTVVQKQVGQTIVQFPQVRQRLATSSQRG